MVTPSPNDILNLAADILNSVFPVISVVGGISIGFALIGLIMNMVKSSFGMAEAAGELVHNAIDPRDWPARGAINIEDTDDEDLEEQADDPEDLYGVAPVRCPSCNGVTDIAGAVGRCKYCGEPLSVDRATRLTGREPMVHREN